MYKRLTYARLPVKNAYIHNPDKRWEEGPYLTDFLYFDQEQEIAFSYVFDSVKTVLESESEILRTMEKRAILIYVRG